jgi:inorganic pyrophosphatase
VIDDEDLRRALTTYFQPHPWHGVEIGARAPDVITAFIEVVPSDAVKYEIDKTSGLLRVDRPQKYSNICPTPYGMVPRTYCADRVATYSSEKAGKQVGGDLDPLDICVLTTAHVTGNVLVDAVPIGGLRMLDGGEADDKIIAVLEGDAAYGKMRDITDAPPALIDRLRHYFLTYKQDPDGGPLPCEITHVYGREEAHEVIRRSQADYDETYGHLTHRLVRFLRNR